MDFFLHLLVAGLIFVAIDSFWIAIVANKFYKAQIKHLLSPKPKFVPAAIFYIIYMVGIIYFALEPALDEDSLSLAAGSGALLGLVMYSTYDLTNQSTLNKWPLKMTLVDMAWGTFVTGLVTVLTFLIFN